MGLGAPQNPSAPTSGTNLHGTLARSRDRLRCARRARAADPSGLRAGRRAARLRPAARTARAESPGRPLRPRCRRRAPSRELPASRLRREPRHRRSPPRRGPLVRRSASSGTRSMVTTSRRQLGEHRRLVARAGADVEDALVRREPEQLADRRHHEGLRDRLSASDRESTVLVGEMAKLLGNEALARHPSHRLEHAFVEASATTELVLDHVCPRSRRSGVGAQRVARRLTWRGSAGRRSGLPVSRACARRAAAPRRSRRIRRAGSGRAGRRGARRIDTYAAIPMRVAPRRIAPRTTAAAERAPMRPAMPPATVSGRSPTSANPKAAPAAAPTTAATPAPTAFTPRSPDRMTPNPSPRPSESPSVYQGPIAVQCREAGIRTEAAHVVV